MNSKSEIKEFVESELSSSGTVCERCILRLSIEKDISLYVDKECNDDVSPKSKICRKNVCCLCFGALQNCISADIINSDIIDVLEVSGHQFSSFILNLYLPASFLIRHRITSVLLKKKGLINAGENLPSVKDVLKWIIGYHIENHFKVYFDAYSEFHIAINISHSQCDDYCQNLLNLNSDIVSKSDHSDSVTLSQKFVTKVLEELSNDELLSLFSKCNIEPLESCNLKAVEFEHDSIYLAGRYNKYSRELSQSPWIIDYKRIMESSVQELITDHIFPVVNPKDIIFSASGREDVDVQCLGLGRPFILECINPKIIKLSQSKLNDLQNIINSSTDKIFIRYFQQVSRADTRILREGEAEKTKCYSCLCCSKDPVGQTQLDSLQKLDQIEINQMTPIRVLHRRNLDTRKRTIYSLSAKSVDTHKFMLHLTTEAGTYIKEFVHGDFGRTKPSLSDLLQTGTDIIYLDVEGVNLDWPKKLENMET